MSRTRIHRLHRRELTILDRVQVAAQWVRRGSVLVLIGWCFFALIWAPIVTAFLFFAP